MQPTNQPPTQPMPPTPNGLPAPGAQLPQPPRGTLPQTPPGPPQPQPPQPQSPESKKQAEARHKDQTDRSTAQRSLLFSELRDEMIIMADGSFRAVVACKSINFDLMSNREREGIEYSYQNFLNSLTFPIQILIRSRRVDISPYIQKLQDIRRSQDNMLLGVLMDDYTQFIAELAEEANIMDKSFYIVVPYYPPGTATKLVSKSKGFFGKLFGGSDPTVTQIDEATYNKAKSELKNRVDAVMNGLFQMGIQCIRLNTTQLGRLYYNTYNPDTSVNQPLEDLSSVNNIYVRKGKGDVLGASLREGTM